MMDNKIMAITKPFEELHIPRKQQPDIIGKYRVYGAAGECVEVSAGTVIEALEVSGVKDAVKVERALLSSMGIIQRGVLATQVVPDAAAVPAT
jgi:hypothetical protein